MTLTFHCYMDFEVDSLVISTLLKNTSVILWIVLEYDHMCERIWRGWFWDVQ